MHNHSVNKKSVVYNIIQNTIFYVNLFVCVRPQAKPRNHYTQRDACYRHTCLYLRTCDTKHKLTSYIQFIHKHTQSERLPVNNRTLLKGMLVLLKTLTLNVNCHFKNFYKTICFSLPY